MPSDRPLIGLYGTGGFAREIMPLIEADLRRKDSGARAVFVQHEPTAPSIGGLEVMSHAAFVAADAEEKAYAIGIGDLKIRQRIYEENLALSIAPLEVLADNVQFIGQNVRGVGGVYCYASVVTADARIGKFFQCNLYSYVAHDCVIGDFVTFAPRVSCNGNVEVRDHAYIGTGAVIRQGRPDCKLVIGEGAVVGMGAIVTKDVAPHTTVVGNPARVMR